jgi:hypothetical protein
MWIVLVVVLVIAASKTGEFEDEDDNTRPAGPSQK